MTNFDNNDELMVQNFLEKNGDKGVAEIEIEIKRLEQEQNYEMCAKLAKEIENYYNNKK